MKFRKNDEVLKLTSLNSGGISGTCNLYPWSWPCVSSVAIRSPGHQMLAGCSVELSRPCSKEVLCAGGEHHQEAQCSPFSAVYFEGNPSQVRLRSFETSASWKPDTISFARRKLWLGPLRYRWGHSKYPVRTMSSTRNYRRPASGLLSQLHTSFN